MMSSKRAIAALALAATLAVLAAGAAIAPESTASNRHASGNRLAGTWVVTVNRPAPLSAITSLQVYTSTGSVIEAANDIGSRSASYGSWERVQGRTYAASSVFFRFDPQTGVQVATHTIDRTIRLSDDGQTFSAVAHAVTRDMSGKVTADLLVPSTGERMHVERIAAQP